MDPLGLSCGGIKSGTQSMLLLTGERPYGVTIPEDQSFLKVTSGSSTAYAKLTPSVSLGE